MNNIILNNLHRLSIIHANSVRKAVRLALFTTVLALLACLACDGIARVNEALIAQDRLSVVERQFAQCLNGGAFEDQDGMLINCSDVRSVKYQLIGGV